MLRHSSLPVDVNRTLLASFLPGNADVLRQRGEVPRYVAEWPFRTYGYGHLAIC